MDDRPRRLTWPARLYLWATYRLYNELAWAYDPVSWLVSLGQWSRWRRRALAPLSGGRVLEVGFGTGELLLEMAGRGWQVCGLELSSAMHRVTARKLCRRGLHVPRLQGDARALPFAAGTLDAVIATFPSQYVLAPATWREVARVLRPPDPSTGTPGGRFVIAGLYVEIDSPLLRQAARLVRTRLRQEVDTRLQLLAAEWGFDLTVVRGEGRWLRAPLFVMEKRAV